MWTWLFAVVPKKARFAFDCIGAIDAAAFKAGQQHRTGHSPLFARAILSARATLRYAPRHIQMELPDAIFEAQS